MKPLVLVVENDARTRKLLGLLMARFGFEADAVARAADALILVDRIDYDVLFIDVVLGNGGGAEILDALAAARPDALDRVVVLSSALETQIEQLKRRWPTVGIVRKPFDLEEIGEAARRVAKDRPQRIDNLADDFWRRSVLAGASSGNVVRVEGRGIED
jgi:DNA-binding NtrC family response regulator